MKEIYYEERIKRRKIVIMKKKGIKLDGEGKKTNTEERTDERMK